MATTDINQDPAGVPQACRLPTAQQPLRVAEFDTLFSTALHAVNRTAPTRLRLVLDGAAEVEATARDLTRREAECCSFFTFSFTRGDDQQLGLDVAVPATHVEVLDELTDRAGAGLAGQRRPGPSVTALRTGQVAAAAGVNVQTLRYYERRGLLAEPERSLGGHRLYPPEAVVTLRVMKAASGSGSPWTRSPFCSTPVGTATAPRLTPGCTSGPAPSSTRSKRASPTCRPSKLLCAARWTPDATT